MSDHYDQNDPDRAGGLISDAQGEFVQQEGGLFDPRAFRNDDPAPPHGGRDAPEREDGPAAGDDRDGPPVNDQRMSSPGAEIDKAG
jgi:hypothetical protein